MEFTLCYRGPLKAVTRKNTRIREKHKLRRIFHNQLKELWNQEPLRSHPEFLMPGKVTTTGSGMDEQGLYTETDDITLLREIKNFDFVPTISADLEMVADLTITLLRPEPPGRIITQGGDIDNKLKTLFDALKVPSADELPPKASPSEEESPFYCLVEDDNLIANLDINTDRLLDSVDDSSEVLLLIKVRTRVLKGTTANLGLI